MANEEHLGRLKQGVATWNAWREANGGTKPDLRGAHLSGAHLTGANLRQADLSQADFSRADLDMADLSQAYLSDTDLRGALLRQSNLTEAGLSGAHLDIADLSGAYLTGANLSGAYLRLAVLSGAYLTEADLSGAYLTDTNLSGAYLHQAVLSGAYLTNANLSGAHLHQAVLNGADLGGAHLGGADLTGADLSGAHLHQADLSGADLGGATLEQALLVETDFRAANLTGCRIYGISAWRVKLDDKTEQKGLVITSRNEPTVTVDDLEVAQFIYLLLNRQKLRAVIDTITSKAVLILGRFTPEERKSVLDAMAEELRKHHLLPIIFDFERPTDTDFTETIKILAGLSLFVIVDLTNPKSAPLELQATVPDYQIPFVPIIQEGEKPFSMFKDLGKFDWVLKPVITYPSAAVLIEVFQQAILERAFQKHQELVQLKAQELSTKSALDYLSGQTAG